MRTAVFLILGLSSPCLSGCGSGSVADSRAAGEPVVVPAVSEPEAAPRRELVENPQYTTWSRFKEGTTVLHRSITRAADNPAVTTTETTYTLLARTDDEVVVSMQAFTKRYDGVEINNPPASFRHPRLLPLPAGMTRADVAKPAGVSEQGEETLQVGGKTYRTRWYKGKDRNEAGEVIVQTWTSDEVPGGLVRSITQTPAIGKTTTLELVEVRTPEPTSSRQG